MRDRALGLPTKDLDFEVYGLELATLEDVFLRYYDGEGERHG